MILGKWPTWRTILFYVFIFINIFINRNKYIEKNCVSRRSFTKNQSLHVSGEYVPIVRRNNCVYATLGTCYSVWMTVWYAGWKFSFHVTCYSVWITVWYVGSPCIPDTMFKLKKFYVSLTQGICVFYVDIRTKIYSFHVQC
jgi:hypothetical protein